MNKSNINEQSAKTEADSNSTAKNKHVCQPNANTNVSSSFFLEVIDKLPHSKSRVPYTYHHDYLREHSKAHNQMSRSEVSSSHTADDTELYAVALTQLLNEIGADAIYHITSNDVFICKKAKEITDAALVRYNGC
jgi:hypothetical protein